MTVHGSHPRPKEDWAIHSGSRRTARALGVIGTTLTGVPLAAPVVLSAVLLLAAGSISFDFLMPGELFSIVIAGGILALAASVIAHHLSVWIGLMTAATAILFGACLWLAEATGLASSRTEPAGWPLFAVVGSYVLYVVSVVGLFVAGVALCRMMFASQTTSHEEMRSSEPASEEER